MAHPDGVGIALIPQPVKQPATTADCHLGPAKFTFITGFDQPAKLLAHGLLAIADTEQWNPQLKDDPGGAGRIRKRNRIRPAGQDDPLGTGGGDGISLCGAGQDPGIDPLFAQTASDQLGHLTAEIEDQYRVIHGKALHIRTVIRRFTGNGDIMNMAFLQPCTGDTDKFSVLLERGDRAIAGIAHGRLQPAKQLVNNG